MREDPEERLNVYDAGGRVIGARPRAEAKRSGLAVGAVNVLLLDPAGRVLLQKRPAGKENGGRWDKSVGGHVDAGESFDATAVREAGEELFGDGRSPRVRLAPDDAALRDIIRAEDLARTVVFRPAALHLNVRDVRHAPKGGLLTVVYHVAVYVGRTDVAVEGFQPPPDEIDALRYVAAEDVDALLARGELAPNMALLWLAHARELLALAGA